MSIEQKFGALFKPEVKSSGRKLIAQKKVSLSSGSDTGIQAFVRVSPPFKVTFSAEDIESVLFSAECTCPAAKKSRFCKHIWATLLAAEDRYPDFFENKHDIGKPEATENSGTNLNSAAASPKQSNDTDEKISYAEASKARANEYRKEQYQKQKLRVKEKKLAQKGLTQSVGKSSYTPELEAALAYFELNGFPMPAGPSEEILGDAKKKLSRVFHPDKGGTHEESVELNLNVSIVQSFLR